MPKHYAQLPYLWSIQPLSTAPQSGVPALTLASYVSQRSHSPSWVSQRSHSPHMCRNAHTRPVWCPSAHTRLICVATLTLAQSGVAEHIVLNDAFRIVTGCLRPTPRDHLPILSDIQPAELCRLGATLALAYRRSLDPDHILYGLLNGSSDARQERLRSRHVFVPAAGNLLNNLAGLGIRASVWTNYKWNEEYCKNTSKLRVFIPIASVRPVGMNLPRIDWVKLNRLRTDVERFHLSMHKWGLAPSPNCECSASKQTADHVYLACPMHRTL